MRKQRNLQKAWVLTTRAYRDTSLIVDCFTLNHGRISVVAKGAKQKRSRFRGLLQAFNCLNISWLEGNSDLYTLTDVEEIPHSSKFLTGTALYCGFYLNELMTRLLHQHDPHPLLFDVYQDALGLISDAEKSDLQRILRIFEKRMLQSIGYGLVLTHEAESGDAVQSDMLYSYIPDVGLVSSNERNLNKSSRCIRGSTLLALETEQPMDAEGNVECKNMMRQILRYYLGDKPLKSRELLQNIY